uniref:Ig-like domain-containing protein n=1 Tax=Crocodylus porosus TaxID=8502 RepID=A0A7M4F4Q1_CROPO
VAPPVFSKKPHPVQSLRGSDVHLECELQGTPPFQISWYKDKREIRSSKKPLILECTYSGTPPIRVSWKKNGIKLSQSEKSTLQILQTDKSLAGQYSCSASNAIGTASSTARLILTG